MSIEQQTKFKKPYKKLGLSVGKKKTGGRNNQGRITAFHRGGGNKLRYIYINTSTANKNVVLNSNNYITQANFQSKVDQKGKDSFEHITETPGRNFYESGEVRYLVRDPNRTAWIAGIFWSSKGASNKEGSVLESTRASNLRIEKNLWYSYYSNMIAPEGLAIGSTVTRPAISKTLNSDNSQVSLLSQTIGNTSYLKDLMVGTIIHNIDGKYIRAAGCSGIIISKASSKKDPSKISDSSTIDASSIKVTVKLQSGQYKVFSGDTLATIGIISNAEHKTRDFRKAGQKRWLGRRPIVRGVAMNPIDHPHGGGEGKSSGGRPSVTPWGKPTKGKPTRSPKKPKKQLV